LDYDNIYNIVNPRDIVTGTPFRTILDDGTNWEWFKPGVVLAFPNESKVTKSNYDTLSIESNFFALTGKNMRSEIDTGAANHNYEVYIAWLQSFPTLYRENHYGEYNGVPWSLIASK
jgi:hypothetical protein